MSTVEVREVVSDWTAFDSREDWPQLQLLMGLNIRDWQYDLSSLLNVYMPGQRTSPLILQQPRDSMQNQLYNEGSQEWQDSKTQLWTQKPTSHLSLGTSSTGMSSEHAACCLVKTMVIFRIHTSWQWDSSEFKKNIYFWTVGKAQTGQCLVQLALLSQISEHRCLHQGTPLL